MISHLGVKKLQQSNTEFGLKRLRTHPFNLKKVKNFWSR